MNYTFDDWLHGCVHDDGPTESELSSFPAPLKSNPYRPAWGKYSEAKRKASFTRAAKIEAQNAEIFSREILPKIEARLRPESLFANARILKSEGLLMKSKFRCWKLGERTAWLPLGDPKEKEAEGMGAIVDSTAKPWAEK